MPKNNEPTQLGKIIEYLHRIGFDRHDGGEPFEPIAASVHISKLADIYNYDVEAAVKGYFSYNSELKEFGFNAERFLLSYLRNIHAEYEEDVRVDPEYANHVNKTLFNFQCDFSWNDSHNEPTEVGLDLNPSA